MKSAPTQSSHIVVAPLTGGGRTLRAPPPWGIVPTLAGSPTTLTRKIVESRT